jgi:hypothetical protein
MNQAEEDDLSSDRGWQHKEISACRLVVSLKIMELLSVSALCLFY